MKHSKIKYQIVGGHGLWQNYKSEGLILEIILESFNGGYIQINEVQSQISGGLSTLDLSILSDGVYEPRLISENRIIRLEPIKKQDGTIAPLTTQDYTVRRLLKRVYELESISNDLQNRVLEIEEKMKTDVIF